MSKKLPVWLLVMVWVLLLSCSFLSQPLAGRVSPPAAPQATQTPEAPQSSGSLTASASSAVSVHLEWKAAAGASAYQLEVRYGSGDFVPLVALPGDRLSYDHFVVPGSSAMAYRLSASTPSGSQPVGSASLQLPALAPHPLKVQFQTYPATLNLSGFDPNNPPNLSDLMKSPSASQQIGSQGGTLALTSPDKVSFSLAVPPGAVSEDTLFTLTPIQGVTGLPLSGGLIGAVMVAPQQEFNLPLTLTIQSPSAAQAPLTVGFAISSYSSEFSLLPLAGSGAQSRAPSAAHLAAPVPQGAGGSSLSVSQGNAYGVGSATQQDVLNQASNVPSDAGAQLAQQTTVQRSADTGLNPEDHATEFRQIGQAILDRATQADTWTRLQDALSSASEYWLEGGAEVNNDLNSRLIDMFLAKIKTLLDKNKGNCLTLEDEYAAELVSKLQNPSNNFWKFLSAAFGTRFGSAGQQLLDDLASGKKSCTFELEINSSISISNPDGGFDIKVHTPKPIQLTLSYVESRLMLQGSGTLTYDQYNMTGTQCKATIKQYPQIGIQIQSLYPVFKNNQVSDFWLLHSSPSADWSSIVKALGSGSGKCMTTSIMIMGGGDPWSGAYVLLRESTDGEVTGWTSPNGFLWDNNTLVATRQIVDRTIAVPQGSLKENTTFKLTIKRKSK